MYLLKFYQFFNAGLELISVRILSWLTMAGWGRRERGDTWGMTQTGGEGSREVSGH